MTWASAHNRAMIRAAHAHADLGMDQGEYVDVYQAVHRAGLELFAKPMDQLFGVYLPYVPGPRGTLSGVLLNLHRSPVDQRHSAAHELGHHVFGHGECAAEGTQVFQDTDPATWPTREKEAEAFAAWFLMPRKAVRKVIARLGVDKITTPDEVYQVALHLGTSYRGTLRHLPNLKLLSRGRVAAWTKLPRGKIRARAGGGLGADRPGEVWALGPAAHGSRLHLTPGDRLVICSAGGSVIPSALPAGVRQQTAALLGGAGTGGLLELEMDGSATLVLDVDDAFSSAGPLQVDMGRSAGPWQAALAPVPGLRLGHNPPS